MTGNAERLMLLIPFCHFRIYSGFYNAIRVFDLQRPGRDCELYPTCPTRKSKDGYKGIVSTLAFSPDRSGLFAAGTFSKSVALHDERDPRHALYVLWGQKGGVTQVSFRRTRV
jgi:hypothetical protein